MEKLEVLTRKEALALGLKHYCTGVACRYGHVAPRLVSTRTCVECAKEKMRRRYHSPDNTQKEYFKNYVAANKERIRERRLLWQRNNKTRLYALSKEYKEANPEKTKALYKAAKVRRRTKATAEERARQARKIKAQPAWVCCKELQAIYEQCRRVSEMIGIVYQVDHIVPLQGKLVCGLHVPWNLQIIPAWANLQKGNRFNV